MYDPTKPSNKIIGDHIRRTWDNKWLNVGEGAYPMFKHKVALGSWEIDHTDGIGTKGVLHWHHKTYRNAVIDAMAMNLNDLLMARATPFKMQNHITLPYEDLDVIDTIMSAMADECIARKICITGGETSIHDDMDGMDISITMSGLVHQRFPNYFNKDATLIGLASSGLHSNGFTHVRNAFLCDTLQFTPAMLTPTRIYSLPDWPFSILGIQHITGGAFTKIRSKMAKDVDVFIHRNHDLKPQDEFFALYKTFNKDADAGMYKTFNCGIGMVLAVHTPDVSKILAKVGGEVIGETRPGNGKIVIESMFSKETVVFGSD